MYQGIFDVNEGVFHSNSKFCDKSDDCLILLITMSNSFRDILQEISMNRWYVKKTVFRVDIRDSHLQYNHGDVLTENGQLSAILDYRGYVTSEVTRLLTPQNGSELLTGAIVTFNLFLLLWRVKSASLVTS